MTGKRDIKVVVQEEVSGCGIACVAMLANTTYNLNPAIGNFGVFATCKICEAPEAQTYMNTSSLR